MHIQTYDLLLFCQKNQHTTKQTFSCIKNNNNAKRNKTQKKKKIRKACTSNHTFCCFFVKACNTLCFLMKFSEVVSDFCSYLRHLWTDFADFKQQNVCLTELLKIWIPEISGAFRKLISTDRQTDGRTDRRTWLNRLRYL